VSTGIANKAVPSEGMLVFVARIVISTIIIFASVLAIDALLLWLLDLDVNAWLTLLFWEGVIMAIFGGGVGWREGPKPIFTPLGKPLTTVKLKYRYPWFWVSLGLAGFLLILLSAYVGLQH
jgi:hypothetical protein